MFDFHSKLVHLLFHFLFDFFSPAWADGFVVIVVEHRPDLFGKPPTLVERSESTCQISACGLNRRPRKRAKTDLDHCCRCPSCMSNVRACSTSDIFRPIDWKLAKEICYQTSHRNKWTRMTHSTPRQLDPPYIHLSLRGTPSGSLIAGHSQEVAMSTKKACRVIQCPPEQESGEMWPYHTQCVATRDARHLVQGHRSFGI